VALWLVEESDLVAMDRGPNCSLDSVWALGQFGRGVGPSAKPSPPQSRDVVLETIMASCSFRCLQSRLFVMFMGPGDCAVIWTRV
jgi:hypothetical protein